MIGWQGDDYEQAWDRVVDDVAENRWLEAELVFIVVENRYWYRFIVIFICGYTVTNLSNLDDLCYLFLASAL